MDAVCSPSILRACGRSVEETEVQRIGKRVAKREATVAEAWWFYVMSELHGAWKAMPEGWDYRKTKAADVPF